MSSDLPHAQFASAVSRREFLKRGALGTSAALVLAPELAVGDEARHFIDVNVSVGDWPLRHLNVNTPQLVAAKLRAAGVTQAWTASLDAVLQKDLAAVNARLVDECRRHGGGRLLPFGSVNPKLPRWEEDLRRCAEVHHFKGLRLYPNYHGYRLDDPAFAHLVNLAAERRLIVQLSLLMEDERMMHPLLRVSPVNTAPLAEIVRQTPSLKLVLLDALGTIKGDALRNLASAGDVSVEISMLEGVGGIARVLELIPPERLLFGSHVPLFYFEAAKLKLKESTLTEHQLRAICFENAQRLLS